MHPLFEKKRIYAPGPTPVPDEVLAQLSNSPIHHRTKEFMLVLERVREDLKYLFQTDERVYLLTSSGTGAMEAAVANCFSTGDKVLILEAGKFGERWAKMAKAFGLEVEILSAPWGESFDPDEVSKTVEKIAGLKGVLFQACETSTGVLHPVEELALKIRKKSDALILVDAITSLGVDPLKMDSWGIDACVTGSQKAMMLPPGLSFLALSKRAQKAREVSNLPRFYYQLNYEDKAFLGGETAWTPAVGLVMGLDQVLCRLREVGLEPLFRHHTRLARATRAGVLAMGLELFAKKNPSNAVTSVLVPQAIEGKRIISTLRDAFGMTVAGGQDAWKGKIFRLAHLGFYDDLDITTCLSALEMTLMKLGYEFEPGAGIGACQRELLK